MSSENKTSLSIEASSQDENEQLYAAIDLGSNSFHMIIARQSHGSVQTVDRHKEMVRLRSGLNAEGYLTPEAFEKGIQCLERFGERLNGIPSNNIRAVGTNTLRNAKNSREFLQQARKALGHSIQIIAGQEEARLIYLGVAHGLPKSDEQRIVMDIGGGSTEFIIGQADKHSHLTSTEMGCVSISEKFFAAGELNNLAFQKAINYCRQILHPHRQQLLKKGWDCAYGASGTIKSVGQILHANQWTQGELTLEAMLKMQHTLCDARHIEQLTIEGLKEERRPVIAGGLAILIATFIELKIESMNVSQNALREGLVFDTLGRIYAQDTREVSVHAMQQWMKVDSEQAHAVAVTAKHLFKSTQKEWQLKQSNLDLKRLLTWAAMLHECGMAISYKRYRQHSAYILNNSDMEGFDQQEKSILSALTYNHRGKPDLTLFDEQEDDLKELLIHLMILLRLAVRVHRGRDNETLKPAISVNGQEIKLTFDEGWLDQHPLTLTDLQSESKRLRGLGYQLSFG